MRRLTERQAAVLDLAEEAIECVVEAVAADEATLAPLSPADAAYIPRLGRAAALVFESSGRRVRLRGAVWRAAAEGRLRFVGGAGADLPARRQAPRAGAELPVEVTELDAGGAPAGPPRRLVTSDVSLGGLGVRAGAWAPRRDASVAFALELPAAPAIRGTARVLRVADGIVGLEIASVAPADRARLAAFLIAGRAA
jgi:hypothetical protein